jgi:hypothetical protein
MEKKAFFPSQLSMEKDLAGHVMHIYDHYQAAMEEDLCKDCDDIWQCDKADGDGTAILSCDYRQPSGLPE